MKDNPVKSKGVSLFLFFVFVLTQISFSQTSRIIDSLRVRIPEELEPVLSRSPRISTIERQRHSDLLEEIEYSMDPVVFDSSAKDRLGRQIGANAALIGKITHTSCKIRIDAKIVEVETGRRLCEDFIISDINRLNDLEERAEVLNELGKKLIGGLELATNQDKRIDLISLNFLSTSDGECQGKTSQKDSTNLPPELRINEPNGRGEDRPQVKPVPQQTSLDQWGRGLGVGGFACVGASIYYYNKAQKKREDVSALLTLQKVQDWSEYVKLRTRADMFIVTTTHLGFSILNRIYLHNRRSKTLLYITLHALSLTGFATLGFIAKGEANAIDQELNSKYSNLSENRVSYSGEHQKYKEMAKFFFLNAAVDALMIMNSILNRNTNKAGIFYKKKPLSFEVRPKQRTSFEISIVLTKYF